MKRYTPYAIIAALIMIIIYLILHPKVVEKKVEVPVEKIKTVEVQKEVEVKNIWIVSEPSNANVIINNEIVGKTPYKLRWENQAFSFSLSKNKFKSISTNISKYQESINVKLMGKGIESAIVTNPSGLEVWKGNTQLGISPLANLWIEKGNHELRFRNNNGINEVKMIEFKKENQLVYQEFDLKKAQVSINSNAENSLVYIDGKELGKTPLMTEITAGKYNLKIINNIYETVEEEIIVDSENGFSKDYEMDLKPAQLLVKAENANLYLDGVDLGSSLFEGSTSAGTHKIKASKLGFMDYEEEHNFDAGKSHFLVLNSFEKIQEASLKNPWIKHRNIGLISSVALIGGGAFFNNQMNSAQSDYDDAGTNSKASSFRDDIERNETLRNSTYFVSLGAIGWTSYSWFKEKQWDKKNRKGAVQ